MKILIHYVAFQTNRVFEFTSDANVPISSNIEDVLEFIFRQCNVVDGDEWISLENRRLIQSGSTQLLRSMYADDVVIFIKDNGQFSAHRCGSIGWEKIS